MVWESQKRVHKIGNSNWERTLRKIQTWTNVDGERFMKNDTENLEKGSYYYINGELSIFVDDEG